MRCGDCVRRAATCSATRRRRPSASRRCSCEHRAEAIGRESALAASRAELDALRQSIPELASRSALAQRVRDLGDRNRELARQLGDFRQQLAAARAPHGEADPPRLPSRRCAPSLDRSRWRSPRRPCCASADGRGAVALYRHLVERCGARFLHHDGGVEDNPHALGSSLDAARCASVCQAGCVSHNATRGQGALQARRQALHLSRQPTWPSFAQQLQGTPCSTRRRLLLGGSAAAITPCSPGCGGDDDDRVAPLPNAYRQTNLVASEADAAVFDPTFPAPHRTPSSSTPGASRSVRRVPADTSGLRPALIVRVRRRRHCVHPMRACARCSRMR